MWWWRHQMESFSALLVNSPNKCQWRGTLLFSLIGAWTNGWVNNRDAGDLRHHRAHYDVTVMRKCFFDDGPLGYTITRTGPALEGLTCREGVFGGVYWSHSLNSPFLYITEWEKCLKKTFESYSYLVSVTTTELRWHLFIIYRGIII